MHHQPDPARTIRSLLARIRSLQVNRAPRDQSRTFWIEGVRQFIQAVEAGFDFDTIVHSKRLLKNALAQKLIRTQAHTDVARASITPEQFRAISITERASGVGAIVRQRWSSIERADPSRGLAWIVVESIRSPGNLGTILRTAEATGCAGVMFLSHQCDPFDPAVVRASMGGIFHLQLLRTNHLRLRHWADEHNVALVALSPHADHLWVDLPQMNRFAIVLGEERRGLSAQAKMLAPLSVRLPMVGRADSLNVSVAASVMMYELVRRQVYAKSCSMPVMTSTDASRVAASSPNPPSIVS